jgi:hypothetical protein
MPVWDRYLTDRDRAVYEAAGYGTNIGFGERPAVLVVDVNYAFVGHQPAPILASIKVWRNSCGEEGWAAVAAIARLIAAALLDQPRPQAGRPGHGSLAEPAQAGGPGAGYRHQSQ